MAGVTKALSLETVISLTLDVLGNRLILVAQTSSYRDCAQIVYIALIS